jgi:hypothetical protein
MNILPLYLNISIFMGNAQKEYMITLFGAFGFTSAPAAWASPALRLPLIRLTRLQKGVKGIHPLGCLPLWGKEGVTFVFFTSTKI